MLWGPWGWWLSSYDAPGELLAGCSAVGWPSHAPRAADAAEASELAVVSAAS